MGAELYFSSPLPSIRKRFEYTQTSDLASPKEFGVSPQQRTIRFDLHNSTQKLQGKYVSIGQWDYFQSFSNARTRFDR